MWCFHINNKQLASKTGIKIPGKPDTAWMSLHWSKAPTLSGGRTTESFPSHYSDCILGDSAMRRYRLKSATLIETQSVSIIQFPTAQLGEPTAQMHNIKSSYLVHGRQAISIHASSRAGWCVASSFDLLQNQRPFSSVGLIRVGLGLISASSATCTSVASSLLEPSVSWSISSQAIFF